jgi:hypothetical protein
MDIRTLVLALGVFCATFLVGWWLNIGTYVYSTGYGTSASYARPAAVAAVPVMATTGQGSAAPGPQAVAHVQTAPPQARPPQPKLPQVKSAQGKDLSQGSQTQGSQTRAAPKPSIRMRRR